MLISFIEVNPHQDHPWLMLVPSMTISRTWVPGIRVLFPLFSCNVPLLWSIGIQFLSRSPLIDAGAPHIHIRDLGTFIGITLAHYGPS
jgi:hypothetical protein